MIFHDESIIRQTFQLEGEEEEVGWGWGGGEGGGFQFQFQKTLLIK